MDSLASNLRQRQLKKNDAYQVVYNTYSNPFHPLVYPSNSDEAERIRALIPSGENINYYDRVAYNTYKNNMKLNKGFDMKNYERPPGRKVTPGNTYTGNVNIVDDKPKYDHSAQMTYMTYGLLAMGGIIFFTLML